MLGLKPALFGSDYRVLVQLFKQAIFKIIRNATDRAW
jgi:hypothetical protein